MTPRVSVLLPVYNGQRYVQQAVNSMLRQSFADFELLILDDGSTDDTPHLLRAVRDSRVRVFAHERNLGLTETLSELLALARGELVARQDADDWSHHERLARQVHSFEAHSALAVLGSQARVVDMRNRAHGRIRRPLDTLSARWALLFDNPFVHSSVMARRATLTALGGYDRAYTIAEDFDLWSRVALSAPVANLPDALVAFRRHSGSVTRAPGSATRAADENRRIIGRNARALLGDAALSDAEIDLLARYRQGLRCAEVGPFSTLLRRALRLFLRANPAAGASREFRRTVARQHLTVLRAAVRAPREPAALAGAIAAAGRSMLTPPLRSLAGVSEEL